MKDLPRFPNSNPSNILKTSTVKAANVVLSLSLWTATNPSIHVVVTADAPLAAVSAILNQSRASGPVTIAKNVMSVGQVKTAKLSVKEVHVIAAVVTVTVTKVLLVMVVVVARRRRPVIGTVLTVQFAKPAILVTSATNLVLVQSLVPLVGVAASVVPTQPVKVSVSAIPAMKLLSDVSIAIIVHMDPTASPNVTVTSKQLVFLVVVTVLATAVLLTTVLVFATQPGAFSTALFNAQVLAAAVAVTVLTESTVMQLAPAADGGLLQIAVAASSTSPVPTVQTSVL